MVFNDKNHAKQPFDRSVAALTIGLDSQTKATSV